MKFLLFTSSTCSACPAMKNNLKKAGIECLELDVDYSHNRAIAKGNYVRSLPTLVIVEDGKHIQSFAGVYPVSELVKIKERYK